MRKGRKSPMNNLLNKAGLGSMDNFIIDQLEKKGVYDTYSFPCGDLNIADAEENTYLEALPISLLIELDEDEEGLPIHNIDWLLEKRTLHPKIPFFYYYTAKYYESNKDLVGLGENTYLFKANCPNTPMYLAEMVVYLLKTKSIPNEKVIDSVFTNGRNIHDYFPNRNFFYIEEVFDILKLFFTEAIIEKRFDDAEKYMKSLELKLGKNNPLLNDCKIMLISQKMPRWKVWLFRVVVLGTVGLILWLLYKLIMWIIGLF